MRIISEETITIENSKYFRHFCAEHCYVGRLSNNNVTDSKLVRHINESQSHANKLQRIHSQTNREFLISKKNLEIGKIRI